MDKDTLNLKLINLEGSPEESISDNNSLVDGFEQLDNLCEGNCYNQIQLILQRANNIIKLKDSQCSAMKDDLIQSLKKSIESLSSPSISTENKSVTDEPETHIQTKACDKNFKNNDPKNNYEPNIKENDIQLLKLQDEISDLKFIIENYKKQVCALEETIIKTKDNLSHWESKAKEGEAKLEEKQKLLRKDNSSVFHSSTWLPFDPEYYSSAELIEPTDVEPFMVPIENDIAGPGWLVMQRRFNGEIDFNRKTVNDYYNGFGDLNGEFWLGLQKVHILTNRKRYELYIHLVDFDDQIRFARYDHFAVGFFNEYQLQTLGAYSGNAGDALRLHRNMKFQMNCLSDSKLYCGNWGLNRNCNLNGIYNETKQGNSDGIWWGCWQKEKVTLKSVQMLIRPYISYI